MSCRSQAADGDVAALLARAGIAQGATAAFLKSRPCISGDFAADCATFSGYWQQAAALRATLPAKLARNAEQVAACDLICGEERTPREAAGGEREALRLEAVLKVALDLLNV